MELHSASTSPTMVEMSTGMILGIESSCDETAAAIVRGGREVLSNVISSQVAMHALYGGVVPELASREHLRNIIPVVREALRSADVHYTDLDAIAVTAGPGLAGALLVGISFAKALSFGLSKPLVAINHLEGHIHAVLMQLATEAPEEESRPTLALVVSGGHTHLYLAEQRDGIWTYRNIGRTVDDAAGEAYDKVAKLLGLPYPGGPWIDRLAAFGNPTAIRFRFSEINRGTPEEPSFDFSFSGIKTAVLRHLQMEAMQAAAENRRRCLEEISRRNAGGSTAPILEDARSLCDPAALDLIASFQHAVVENLVKQTMRAARQHGVTRIVVSGGVASNRALRTRFQEAGKEFGATVHFPAAALSTDNAAMIAAAAWPHFVQKEFAGSALNAAPQLRLGEPPQTIR